MIGMSARCGTPAMAQPAVANPAVRTLLWQARCSKPCSGDIVVQACCCKPCCSIRVVASLLLPHLLCRARCCFVRRRLIKGSTSHIKALLEMPGATRERECERVVVHHRHAEPHDLDDPWSWWRPRLEGMRGQRMRRGYV